jgi:hypothetical protein
MQATLTAPTPRNGSVPKLTRVEEDRRAFNVFVTNDYDKFKILKDNRDLNEMHIRRIVESFKEKHLVCPIIVNEKYQVIDGQHRLRASRETESPVYYIVIPGYGIDEVQVLNANQKNWNKMDFLEMFCAQGKKPYLEFREFMSHFPDLGFIACESILVGTRDGRRTKTIGGLEVTMKDFQEGRLRIPNLAQSYRDARKLMEFKPFYEGIDRRVFVAAVLPLFTSKVYNHKEMIYKLSVAPMKLTHLQNVSQYRDALENIYNWKRQKENKVSFKYLQAS